MGMHGITTSAYRSLPKTCTVMAGFRMDGSRLFFHGLMPWSFVMYTVCESHGESAMTATLQKVHVLFVDDEPSTLAGYRKAAKTLCPDWQVSIASSGDEALALLIAWPIDIVIADIGMDGMSGTDLQRKIMNDFPHVLRVILSGMLDGRSIVESSKFSEVRLCKPSPMATIRYEVEKAMSLRLKK